jgi:hypothetical protein
MYSITPQSSEIVSMRVQPKRGASHPRINAVRERGHGYEAGWGRPNFEPGGSERRTLGSVSVTEGALWTATLTVPVPEQDAAFLEVTRRGSLPRGYRGGNEGAHLSIPPGELNAVVALVLGVVEQARRDGVLPAQSA